jgi:hypothetical protein
VEDFEYFEEEGEVDLREKLISALEELGKERKKENRVTQGKVK